jgi:hypothetical protein
MAGFMDIFTGNKQQNQQQQNQNQDGNNPNNQQQQQQNQQNMQGNNPNNMNGNADPNNPNGGTPANPLDAYAKMWDTAANTQAETPPAFALDQETLDKVTSGLDFTKGVDQTLVQQALAGNAEALLKVINAASQQAYKSAMAHTSTLTDKFVSIREQHAQKGVDSRVRQNLTAQALASTPNYNHPVVKNQLNQIANQIAAQNPDASPQEIAETAKKYLNDLINAINPQSNTNGSQGEDGQQTGEVDWTSYLTQSSTQQ